MRIGVIGCGGMGTTHYLSLKVLSEKEDDLSSKLSACRTCSEGTGKRDECTGGKTGMSDRRGLPDAS